jgi:hypothetical protein
VNILLYIVLFRGESMSCLVVCTKIQYRSYYEYMSIKRKARFLGICSGYVKGRVVGNIPKRVLSSHTIWVIINLLYWETGVKCLSARSL